LSPVAATTSPSACSIAATSKGSIAASCSRTCASTSALLVEPALACRQVGGGPS